MLGPLADRLSDLPRNVIDNILERLPMCDAARTSVLCRAWRHYWINHPQLLLDEEFFKSSIKIQADFVREVYRILLIHKRPILKFVLHVPKISADRFLDIDLWMLHLSEDGIRELTLVNMNTTRYCLPSYLFSCTKLTCLKLTGCVLKMPPSSATFCCLASLVLENISFSVTGSEAAVLFLPVLRSLHITSCSDLEHFRFHAPLLNWFHLVSSIGFDRLCATTFPKVKVLAIALGEKEEDVGMKPIDVLNFLGLFPNVHNLLLDGFFLMFLATISDQVLSTTVKLNQLKRLYLLNVQFGDLDQVQCALCLLQHLPMLENLSVKVSRIVKDGIEPVLRYLEARDCMEETFNRLEVVKIDMSSRECRAELLFAKLLLARCRSLVKMEIKHVAAVGPDEVMRVARALAQFPRASTTAELICS